MNVQKALKLFAELLQVQKRVLGWDHPSTLRTRNNFVCWISESRGAQTALPLLASLFPDYERVLGPDHQETLIVLCRLGVCTVRTGGRDVGCRMLREGLARTEARVGPAHSVAQQFRNASHELDCGDRLIDWRLQPHAYRLSRRRWLGRVTQGACATRSRCRRERR